MEDMMSRLPLALIVSLILIVPLFSSASNVISGDQPVRSRISFNNAWLFARFGSMPDGSTKDEPQGLGSRDLDDGSWRKLDLPHDWGIEGPFRADLPSSTGKLPWAGIGWYRKHFNVSARDRGMRFFIDFDGAMSHARVWLNGQYLGEWPYGYASFRLEMTSQIRFGARNVLAVRLDNPPNSSRWYPGGGIYRNVWLVKTGGVHVAYGGVFVTTPRVTGKSAIVHIRTQIENQSDAPVDAALQVNISQTGKSAVVAVAPDTRVQIPAGGIQTSEIEVSIPSPDLWDLQSPALYDVQTSIRTNHVLVDSIRTVFGIRTAEFSADNGFVLNGRRVRLNGVCNHHDLGLLGTAVNESALKRQIRLLQEMGCNAIRTSHNPPAPELLDLCDRMGMLVLDEAFDCWVKGKTPNDYNTLFREWHERDIRALVRRDRNHPSVIAWSAGNEVREQGDGNLIQQLKEIFRAEDPTRPVTAACDNPEAGFNGFQNVVDVFGYNYKPHLYAKFRGANPSTPLFGSETASCISTFGEYLFPVSDDKSKGAFNSQVSSYDLYAPPWATIPDVEFEAQDRNPFVAGEFVWTGFDYLGEPTPYGEDTCQSRSAYFGILDLCGFKKDRFYLYQARWRPDVPMAHILPHWNWPDRIGQITPVHVYTSGDEAELFLNGRSLGKKVKGAYQYRLRWDDVKYAPGEVKVIAYKAGKEWTVESVRTTGPASRLALSADRAKIAADGRDLSFVAVSVVDKDGLRVPTAGNPVHFRIDGPGVIAAVGNGDPTDHGSFQSDQTRSFHGKCLLIVRSIGGKTGLIRVAAKSDGLREASVEIRAK
jgi:beta-galactosidase